MDSNMCADMFIPLCVAAVASLTSFPHLKNSRLNPRAGTHSRIKNGNPAVGWLVAIWILTGFTIVVVSVRLGRRTAQKSGFTLPDLFIAAATLSLIFYTALLHAATVELPETPKHVYHYLLPTRSLFPLIISLAHAAIVRTMQNNLFRLTIPPVRKLTRFIHLVLTLVGLVGLVTTITTLLSCFPISSYWTAPYHSTDCFPEIKFSFANSIIMTSETVMVTVAVIVANLALRPREASTDGQLKWNRKTKVQAGLMICGAIIMYASHVVLIWLCADTLDSVSPNSSPAHPTSTHFYKFWLITTLLLAAGVCTSTVVP